VAGIFKGVRSGQRLRLITSAPSVCPLSRKCGSLNASKAYGPPWLVLGIFYETAEKAAVFYTLIFRFYKARGKIKGWN
jgi:hypothetical protein